MPRRSELRVPDDHSSGEKQKAFAVCLILLIVTSKEVLADQPIPLISGIEETSEELVYRYAKRQGWRDPPVVHDTRSGIVVLWSYDDQGNCRPVDQIRPDKHQNKGAEREHEAARDAGHDAAP